MLTLTFSLLAVIALGLLVLVRAVKAAPAGFEDAEGFHAVREGRMNPVKASTGDKAPALMPSALAA